jgi:DNA-binding transcriptional LysR family regulator
MGKAHWIHGDYWSKYPRRPFRFSLGLIVMANQIDLRDLRYFATIAELGHLGHAAERLNRSQPTLTGAIRRLEETFGTALFEPLGRGIRLTPAGRVLVARAKRLLVTTEDLTREMEDLARGHAGHVSIGVVPTAAQHLFPTVARAFLAEAKDVTLKAVIGQIDVLSTSLKAGELDLVIGLALEPLGNPDSDFVAFPIVEDTVVVVASKSHEIFDKRPKMKDLLAYRWVLASTEVQTRVWLDNIFEAHGLPRPQAQIEANLVLMLPPLIVQTGFLSFLSRRHLAPGGLGSSLKEVVLRETTMRRWFTVLYRKDSYLPPAALGLVNMLQTQAKTLFPNVK